MPVTDQSPDRGWAAWNCFLHYFSKCHKQNFHTSICWQLWDTQLLCGHWPLWRSSLPQEGVCLGFLLESYRQNLVENADSWAPNRNDRVSSMKARNLHFPTSNTKYLPCKGFLMQHPHSALESCVVWGKLFVIYQPQCHRTKRTEQLSLSWRGMLIAQMRWVLTQRQHSLSIIYSY